MNLRGGDTPETVRAWIAKTIERRNFLMTLPGVTKEMLFEVYLIGLDGDDPAEFRELTNLFFKGRQNPVAYATQRLSKWMKETGL